MLYDDPLQAAPAFLERLSSARQPLLLTHLNPDGDAIGALLGMWHALRLIGKQPLALALPPLPHYVLWLPGVEHIHIYRPGEQLPDCDLIVMLDTATVARTGVIAEEHGPRLATTPLSIIDHHVTNGGAGSLDLVQPAAASTCELLQQLFEAMGIALTPELATCLLLGLTTDTQSFQTHSTTSTTLRSAARLIDAGARQHAVVQQVYNNLPASTVALVGRSLSALRCEAHVAWTTVTRAMLAETGAEEDAIDEVLRVMQRLGDMRALVLFKERADGTTKMSLRSRPPLDVARIAQRWGGGGHSQASGATLAMPPEQAAGEVVPILQGIVAAAGQAHHL